MSEPYFWLASIFPFFVPAIRDYIDVLNNVYDSVLSDINLQQIVHQSFLFFIGSIKFTILYFLSFQWIRDLTYLPILVPQFKLEILKEHFFLQTPESNFFTFLEIPSYTNNKFFLGFFNSFFLCLPLSIAHIISTRRLLIQGIAAGIVSNLGTICGQTVLLICILFGGRFFITSWFNFQVLNYFLGLCLALHIIYDMAHERSIRIIDGKNRFLLLKIFFLNFALTWTEQSCIFQYFGNVTFGAEPTIIEIFSSPTEIQSIFTHTSYIVGIFIGSLVFTSIFIFICLELSNLVVKVSSLYYSQWIRKVNFSLLVLSIAFSFTSIPFYSFDYLIFSNLGFVSQDKSFKNTVFSPTKIHDFVPNPVLGEKNNSSFDKKIGIDNDITAFDKGRYLMFDTKDSFEQLNYQGEYAWIIKTHKTPKVSRDPSSFAILKNFSKFFQKLKKKPSSMATPSNVSNNFRTNLETVNSESTEYSDKFSEIDSENINNVLNFRTKQENKISNFFENLVHQSVQNRFLIDEQVKNPALQKNFRQKYYSNPIYKLLLNLDIDFFLARQPRSFLLTPTQENELLEKRFILANYYDSLRYYTQLPYQLEFEDVFNGSKSYADRVYNHQFKGTLKIVRRLFSISFSPFYNNLNTPILPIQSDPNSLQSTVETTVTSPGDFPSLAAEIEKPRSKYVNNKNILLKFDQPLYKKPSNQLFQSTLSASNNKNDTFHPIFHEEFRLNTKISEKVQQSSNVSNDETNCMNCFIQLTNPIPFYVGWDEQLRKLVITNRLSPRYSAGDSIKFFNKSFTTHYPKLTKTPHKNQTIEFTTWPVSKMILNQLNGEPTLSYNLLFDSLNIVPQDSLEKVSNKLLNDEFLNYEEDYSEDFGPIETIPINIAKNEGKIESQLDDIIPYTRGGFIWPGHSNLKFEFKNLQPSK